ncbi:SDR family NAD(P)-dependent oxidoreductase [Pseudocolwellia agarivorans]|uniref:SDR family NAD(P)-dependent oxidoreductase n=1 Tax=Pseudocolwellia agarivorans TaxID=1911682 RepID=UPI003F880E4F
MTNLQFKHSTVLITGASSGIGKAFAQRLAKQGANLIITARSAVDLAKLADELTMANQGIQVNYIPIDLSTLNGAKQLISHIKELNLSVDYLINNAGFGKWCTFSNEDYATYECMLLLNINALVELSYHYLPKLIAQNKGGIINVASTAAFQPLPYQAVYGASKAFVLNFSEALSGELLDSNVHVMALCPGVTESNFMTVANADTTGMTSSTAEDVVEVALKGFGKRRIYIIEGMANYFNSLISRFVPRKLIVKITAGMFKDRVS